MQRYVKVRGVAGRLVLDPRAPDANPRRFVGMRRKPDVEKWTALADLYEPVTDVLLRGELLTCVAAGDLELLGECTAVDAQAASLALTVMPDAPKALKNALRAKDGE